MLASYFGAAARVTTERPKLHLHHGPIEIERKFLVANDEWRQSAVRSVGIRDGLIAVYKDRKVRVRDAASIRSRFGGEAPPA
jgi:hypothetical protein